MWTVQIAASLEYYIEVFSYTFFLSYFLKKIKYKFFC